jgi:hypothetical protein
MSASEDDIAFTCPDCGETMVVNPAMRDAPPANGCVVCGAAVAESAFDVHRTLAGRPAEAPRGRPRHRRLTETTEET